MADVKIQPMCDHNQEIAEGTKPVREPKKKVCASYLGSNIIVM